MTASTDNKLLTEYEAAVMVGLSPDLLRWLTKYAPKQGDPRKLKIAKEKNGMLFFEATELLSFNEWLKQPWPHQDGKRPPMPSEIRNEIKKEANGECAICNAHKDTCEAAHLDPVAKSNNNHPENLLWLCRNHHKAYDGGLFGPDEENAEFVKSFKVTLHRHKMRMWSMQSELSSKLLNLLADCDRLGRQLALAKTTEQVNAVKRLAKDTLSELGSFAPVSHADPAYSAFKAVSEQLKALPAKKLDDSSLKGKLKTAQNIRKKFSSIRGYVQCPLCEGSGDLRGEACPECGGDGEMPKWRAAKVDVSRYREVKCPLCEGKGDFGRETCPECGGDGEMPQWRAEKVDVSQYRDVKCPLCEGKGDFGSETCPECGGDGEMPQWRAEKVDVSQYRDVKCPLCEGKGDFGSETCPECGGDGEMPQRRAEKVDVSQYRDVKCPLCDGSGDYGDAACPVCAGEGQMPRWRAEEVDLSEYE